VQRCREVGGAATLSEMGATAPNEFGQAWHLSNSDAKGPGLYAT
jgi:hypothetical protein